MSLNQHMSKSFIPYHLRQSKAIDRNLFLDLLGAINRKFAIREYEYISMGGPFLEDFKIVHNVTGISKMVSFDESGNTILRQKYNRPFKCVRLKHETSSEFILRYTFPHKTIVWLDFTTPSRLQHDLSDVVALLGKLKRGDVVKVTLNAHFPDVAVEDVPPLERRKAKLAKLEDQIGDYLPNDVDESMMNQSLYPTALFKVLKLVFDNGLVGSPDLYFQPLSSFYYADGQQMLTFSGVLLNRQTDEKFLNESGLNKWYFSVVDKSEPMAIRIPQLSLKERMQFDSLLPKSTAESIQKKFKYLFADEPEDSIAAINDYVNYYRMYPYFSKIVI